MQKSTLISKSNMPCQNPTVKMSKISGVDLEVQIKSKGRTASDSRKGLLKGRPSVTSLPIISSIKIRKVYPKGPREPKDNETAKKQSYRPQIHPKTILNMI